MPVRHAVSGAPAALVTSLALLVGSGCGTFLDGTAANECSTDDECSGARCDVDRAICVGDRPPSMRVGFVVVPASDPLGGTPLPVSFPAAELAAGSEHDIVVPLSVSVSGTVRSLGDPVSAAITFTLVSELPGVAPTRIETQTFARPMLVAGEMLDYSVQLLPDREYDVTVQPAGPWQSKLPPLRARYRSPSASARTDLVYPDEMLSIRGEIVDLAGNGQAGMLVRAVDATSGRVISSVSTTGSDPEQAPGWFEIRMDPRATSYFISVNASPSRIEAGRPSPSFSVDPNALLETEHGVTIRIPPIADEVITYSGSVEPADSPGHGTAATLTFTSRDVTDSTTGVVGTFRAMVATDPSGAFTVQLLPGTYDVVVTPTGSELGRELGVLRETGIILGGEHASVMGTVFELPARTHYNPVVQTPDGRPVANAQVHAVSRGSTDGGALLDVALYARSSDAMTDPDGRFDLPLDVGVYDLTVEPPAGSNWAWYVDPHFVNGTLDVTIGDLVQLSPPIPVHGHVSFAEERPIANGEVRAYAIVEENGEQRAVQIGRAQSDADGAFTLLLPPTP